VAERKSSVAAVAHRTRHLRWRAQRVIGRARRRAERVNETLAGVNLLVSAGSVALTFDDGPHPGSTDRILDVLADLQVPATFFCVGKNARAHPELLRRIEAEGHAIGSHSFTHPHPRETRHGALRAEYRDGRAAVEDVLGREVRLFRPPHGHLNPAGALMIRRLGMQPWLWSVDPTDWRPGVTRVEVTEVASRAASGDVVLFHDWVEQPFAPSALDRTATIQSLPDVISAVRRRGLTLVTVES